MTCEQHSVYSLQSHTEQLAIKDSRLRPVSAQRIVRLHPQSNIRVYGEAYGRGVSVSGRQRREGGAETLKLIASSS